MTTSGNKSVQLCMPEANAAYTGLDTYWNGFFEVCLAQKLKSLYEFLY